MHITDDQIRALRREAAEASDLAQMVLCDLALEGEVDLEDYSGGGGWNADEWRRAGSVIIKVGYDPDRARRELVGCVAAARAMDDTMESTLEDDEEGSTP
jgi:hypothetical protein